MPNYFYIDENGNRQGPINHTQLAAMAARGIITPDKGADNAREAKASARFPHAQSPADGFSIVENGRMECESEVEDFLQAFCADWLPKIKRGEITKKQYHAECKKLTPKDAVEWIIENVPKFKDKNFEGKKLERFKERLENGVKYSDTWRDKAHYLDTPSKPPVRKKRKKRLKQ